MTTGSGKKSDIIGQVFGRLTVMKNIGFENGRTQYECQCSCGNIKRTNRNQLLNGVTKSCGCLFRDTLNARNTTHGQSKGRLFRIWSGMISRCEIPSATGYERYGAKGITVCERWRDSFEAFKEDVGECPSDEHSLDRKDNHLGYFKDNCRWATPKRQAYNSSRARLIEFNGVTANVSDWERASGLKACIGYRLDHGWSVRDAILTPTKNMTAPIVESEVMVNVQKLVSEIDIISRKESPCGYPPSSTN